MKKLTLVFLSLLAGTAAAQNVRTVMADTNGVIRGNAALEARFAYAYSPTNPPPQSAATDAVARATAAYAYSPTNPPPLASAFTNATLAGLTTLADPDNEGRLGYLHNDSLTFEGDSGAPLYGGFSGREATVYSYYGDSSNALVAIDITTGVPRLMFGWAPPSPGVGDWSTAVWTSRERTGAHELASKADVAAATGSLVFVESDVKALAALATSRTDRVWAGSSVWWTASGSNTWTRHTVNTVTNENLAVVTFSEDFGYTDEGVFHPFPFDSYVGTIGEVYGNMGGPGYPELNGWVVKFGYDGEWHVVHYYPSALWYAPSTEAFPITVNSTVFGNESGSATFNVFTETVTNSVTYILPTNTVGNIDYVALTNCFGAALTNQGVWAAVEDAVWAADAAAGTANAALSAAAGKLDRQGGTATNLSVSGTLTVNGTNVCVQCWQTVYALASQSATATVTPGWRVFTTATTNGIGSLNGDLIARQWSALELNYGTLAAAPETSNSVAWAAYGIGGYSARIASFTLPAVTSATYTNIVIVIPPYTTHASYGWGGTYVNLVITSVRTNTAGIVDIYRARWRPATSAQIAGYQVAQ